tara:strand:- start:241 stop:546 length:306 start_codon:yes stop_codon:yes gene_type:complete
VISIKKALFSAIVRQGGVPRDFSGPPHYVGSTLQLRHQFLPNFFQEISMALLKEKRKAAKKPTPKVKTVVEEAPVVELDTSQQRLDQRSVGLRRLGGKVVA